ncbi:MAG: polysulfide reductase NrfD [Desulfarculus sp.]|nr:polysulfide reductase NrfD [Desulfarculus sp.]
MNDKTFKTVAGLAGLGLVIGAWSLIQRLMYGLNPVAFGSYVPWGLWVAFYLFFLGLSAGAFLITILAYVFCQEKYESLARLAALTVLVSIVCELLFITLDLGRLERIYQFLLTPSFTSLMFWMFILVNAMGAIYTFKLWFMVKGYEAKVRSLSWLSLPVGLLFYGVNGAFFAILLDRPLWNNGLTPVLFILAALLSGGALITWLGWLFRRDQDLTRALGRVVLGLLLAFLLMELCQLVVAWWSGGALARDALKALLVGPNWWVFWLVHLGLGSLLPLFLLSCREAPASRSALACLIIVVAFVAARYAFLLPDLMSLRVQGLEDAFVHMRLSTAYAPNLNEWLVCLWVVSLGVLLFALGSRYLPILEREQGGEHV